MKEKIKKLLFEYSENSRITTKELGKKINASQQSAFYLLSTLKEKKNILGEATIVDAQKLGYTNTLVGFNYIRLNEKTKTKVIDYLKKIPEIISIEEADEGFDILTEFSTKNLAALDNLHREITNELEQEINTAFIFPVITKYMNQKKYLKRPKIKKTKVLFGDREQKKLTEHEKEILAQLIKEPTKKLVDISADTKMSAKSITKIKKELEKKYIIKGYAAILDHRSLGIDRDIIFIRLPSSGFREIKEFIEYTKQNDNVIEIIKTIGSSQIVITTEKLNGDNIINELRSKFSIQSYMVFRCSRINKKMYLPENFMEQ